MESENELEALEMRIFRLMRVFQLRFAQDLSRYDITFPQFMTLLFLERTDKPCRMGPLAEATMQSAPSTTAIVDRLLERGLVERQRDPRDRRSVVVSLTEAGEQLVRQIKADRHHTVKRALGQLVPEERACLRDILDRIARFLETMEDVKEDLP